LSRLWIGLLTTAALAAGVWYAYPELVGSPSSKANLPESWMIGEVKRGSFLVSINEKGTIDSLRNAILSSKVEGSTTIISIVREGTQVKEGDLLVELDSSALVEKETQQRIAVTQAQAALAQAQEDYAIQKTQNDSDIAAAELKLRLAELDLKKFQEGEYLQQQNELTGQVTLARENVTRAKDSEAFVKRLARKGYRSQNDVEAERIAVAKAEIDFKVASEKLRVLEEFNYTRNLEELKANAEEYRRELERTRRKASSALLQKKALLDSKELTDEVETNKHKRLKMQIENCKIFAPQDGQVVYANTRDGRPDQSVLIEEGASVRERQAIINLPDFDAMKVNARIHESRISLIKPGQEVRIRVDAYASEVFEGTVDGVSSVPLSNSFGRTDVKEYEAVIRFRGTGEQVNKLRPGLTAGIEVIVDRRDDVLQAPVQSIVTIGKEHHAFVIEGSRGVRKPITIGQTNDRVVEVISGLKAGDQVVMNPRTQFAKEVGELEAQWAKQQAQSPERGPDSTGIPPAVPQAGPAKPAAPPPGEQDPRPKQGTDGAPQRGPRLSFKEQDKDGDGKLSPAEVSGPLADNFAQVDTDHDGFISEPEMQAMIQRFRRGGGPPQ
jgi:HlyD family secretion protein